MYAKDSEPVVPIEMGPVYNPYESGKQKRVRLR